MPIQSDLTIDAAKFNTSNVTDEVKKVNEFIETATKNGPKWYEVGAEKYRQMGETGEALLPAPIYLPDAIDATLPSREAGRDIPLRVFKPENGLPSKGIFLLFHGGGFVLGSHKHSDTKLKAYANKCQLTAISVGYRLAPENPYPAGINDCIDAAEYLINHAEKDYKAKLTLMGGVSYGGCLAALTVFRLMRSRPKHQLAGVVFLYPWLDVSLGLPKVTSFTRPLVINFEVLQQFANAYAPNTSIEERKHPQVSPLYEDMQGLSLPPALFLCGTEDPLLDDTLLMSMKWMAAGGEAILKVYPGAPHGFNVLPVKVADGNAAILEFMQEKLEAVAQMQGD
ncbi:alpha/beta hydrolase fold-3 domain-containing protein [Nannizzia gypsea CBS 118893]|uniref:Alpha/beta hydrolase fold-3 domain-containing protein n=1 Tax=Arthroderma gypseum (strain ATCC MYA-4604 / CBS 118893) TaxID=535722 RepID=E4USM3_ARTGP|nr:alpha/beta hydrolase fold-3 domain-containing protein [Nannizzia gypsea CBS 118893]EFR01374.1 alpha/beta hydrolase fold-3 domain-containing protein [Nannizzia gypsea CBS 118893]